MAQLRQSSIPTAFHAEGRESFRKVEQERLWSACRILRHRLDTRCQPVSLTGHLRILIARRRWLRRIRKRFARPQALFLGPPAIFRIRCCSRGHCG